MTAAEKLRQEITATFPMTKDEFISSLCKDIKSHGYKCFYCDRHIYQTDRSAIRMADEPTAIKYASSEGFSYHYEYNSYGVRKIVFTL